VLKSVGELVSARALAQPPDRRDTAQMRASAHGTVELVLERDHVEPGEAIRGRVTPGTRVWAVDLVRVESSPAATLEFTAASAAPGSDGTFDLEVPPDAPPSVAGRACTLVWRVRARAGEYPQPSDARHTLEIACPS
jgi:hypothetical protein